MTATPEPETAEQTGYLPPPPPDATTEPEGEPAPTTNVGTDRGDVIAGGLRALAAWSLRFIIVVLAAGLLFWLMGQLWVGVFPLFMALILSTVLWPAVRFLGSRGWPNGLAAAFSMVVGIGLIVGVGMAIAPSIASQSSEVVDRAGEGVVAVERWLAGPPLNIDSNQLSDLTTQGTEWLRGRAGGIASGVFAGAAAIGSAVVTTLLVLVLTFFFLKDGPGFLPWLRVMSGRRAGMHLTELSTRVYRTLSGFIRTQALVGFIDALMIGVGLVILQVPLAFALAILTFFAAFIPVVGAVVAGVFAILVALVTNGFTTAVIVLAIVLAVQQIEGNVLLPILQSKSMDLHAGIVLIAITVGGTLFGIVGAFLAVPVAASAVVILRYFSEQVDLRTGDLSADEIPVTTPEGKVISRHTEEVGRGRRREALEGSIVEAPQDVAAPREASAAPTKARSGARAVAATGPRSAGLWSRLISLLQRMGLRSRP